MKKTEFEIKIITPLFNFGTNKKTEELRAQSLKGLLRFWWRTVSGIQESERLLDKENEIFGSSDNGKSKVNVKIEIISNKRSNSDLPKHMVPVKGKNFKINILDYLAYGPSSYSKEKKRMVVSDYIATESEFKIVISSFDENSYREALKAFYLLERFGNIGAKSRNGFGGFEIIDGEFNYDFSEDIEQALEKPLNPYTSFSKESKIYRTKKTYDYWHSALSEIGKLYRSARLSLEKKHQFYKRQYISAPIMDRGRNRAFLERHAKSLFLKVRKEDNRYRGYIIYLPYKYLENNPKRRDDSLRRYNEAYEGLLNDIRNSLEEVKFV